MSKALFSFLAPSEAEEEEVATGSVTEEKDGDQKESQSQSKDDADNNKDQQPQPAPNSHNEPWKSYPNLFVEAYYPTAGAAAIFSVASIRRAARLGIIDAPELHSLPLRASTVFEAFHRHKDALKGKIRPDDYDYFEYLETHMEQYFPNWKPEHVTIHEFGDERETQECVYSMTTNDKSEMIMVCFRGSVTVQDWLKDSKVVVGNVRNPLGVFRADQPEELGVHLGFREYLYANDRNTTNSRRDDHSTTTISTVRELGKQAHKNALRVTQEMVAKTQSLVRANTFQLSTEPANGKGSNNNDGDDDDNNDKETMNQQENDAKGSPKELANSSANDQTATAANGTRDAGEPDKTTTTTTSSQVTSEDTADKTSNGGTDIANANTPEATDETEGEEAPPPTVSKLHMVLQQLHALMKQYPDYKVYITGHSLGGALGLLVALEAACLFATKGRPITFVGVANPRAGTTGFREAVELLEREQKLRCLGVYNQYDLVPMLPASWLSYRRMGCRSWYRTKFCQVGVRLTLYEVKNKKRPKDPNKEYWIYYSGGRETYRHKWKRKAGWRLRVFLCEAYKVPERHHYMTYLNRLLELRDVLSQMHLNECYNEMVQKDLYPTPEKATARPPKNSRTTILRNFLSQKTSQNTS